MNFLKKALHFFYGGTLRYLVFLFAVALFLAAGMTLIAYPMQSVIFIVVGGGILSLFIGCHDYR